MKTVYAEVQGKVLLQDLVSKHSNNLSFIASSVMELFCLSPHSPGDLWNSTNENVCQFIANISVLWE